MKYLRSLDGLRAIAIVLVMSVHYHQKFGGGWMGVQLFFVISGFLITRILLDAKSSLSGGAGTAAFKTYLARFLVRRSLRIVPLYFGFIGLLALLYAMCGIPENWMQTRWWLLSYTLNIGHMLHQLPVDDLYSHFWSLAVEEQFYLVWPFVVWGLSKVALRRVVLAILLLAPLLRGLMVAQGAQVDQLYFFTPCQMDAFAAGAALTLFELPVRKPVSALLGVGALTIFAGLLANWQFNYKFAISTAGYPYYLPHYGQYVWGYSLLNLSAMLAIFACQKGTLRWLEWRPPVHIGQISYGLYVFHRPVVGLLDRYAVPYLHYRSVPQRATDAVLVLLYLGISYVLAWSSFRWIESPFLRLKDIWYPTRA